MKKGFTLLELLIVVIIIGILAGLAVPNFFRGVERARWSEAKQLLGSLRGSQIRYRANAGSYTDALGDLDVESTTVKYFTIAVANDANALVTATRNGVQDTYTLNGETISINLDGDFTYSGGVPSWMR